MPAFKRYRLHELAQADTAGDVIVEQFFHLSLDLFLQLRVFGQPSLCNRYWLGLLSYSLSGLENQVGKCLGLR